MNKKNKKFSTKAIHVGQNPEKLYGAVSLPIYLTSPFKKKSSENMNMIIQELEIQQEQI